MILAVFGTGVLFISKACHLQLSHKTSVIKCMFVPAVAVITSDTSIIKLCKAIDSGCPTVIIAASQFPNECSIE